MIFIPISTIIATITRFSSQVLVWKGTTSFMFLFPVPCSLFPVACCLPRSAITIMKDTALLCPYDRNIQQMKNSRGIVSRFLAYQAILRNNLINKISTWTGLSLVERSLVISYWSLVIGIFPDRKSQLKQIQAKRSKLKHIKKGAD